MPRTFGLYDVGPRASRGHHSGKTSKKIRKRNKIAASEIVSAASLINFMHNFQRIRIIKIRVRAEDLFMLLKITQIENEQEPEVKYFFDAWESSNDPEEPLLQCLDD